ITDGARRRFELAQWQEAQQASAERINLYEDKVAETVEALRRAFPERLLEVDLWPQVKADYINQIDLRFDDELAETWFNSIFCSLFSHDCISDDCMFIHSTRPALQGGERGVQTRSYLPRGDLRKALAGILDDYRFDVPYARLEEDLDHLEARLRGTLPDWVCKDPQLCIELISSTFYRNKGAYLVGRIYTPEEQWPLVIPLVHPEEGIRVDTLITDEAEVSIIFSFTRSYFMVEITV